MFASLITVKLLLNNPYCIMRQENKGDLILQLLDQHMNFWVDNLICAFDYQ